jgi:hypothetical protein
MRLEVHDTLRLIGLAVEDGAELAEDGDLITVLLLHGQGSEVARRRQMALDRHVVLDRDGNAVQRTDHLAGLLEVLVQFLRTLEAFLNEEVGKAVDKLVGNGGALAESGEGVDSGQLSLRNAWIRGK